MANQKLPAIQGGSPVRQKMLPFHRATIGDDEVNAVTRTLLSGWLTTGPQTKEFEKRLAGYLGAEGVVCLNSCTSALHLALSVLNVGPGDEVITSPITFPSTANVIVHRGAKVVFADVEPETLNISPQQLEQKITSKTKAVIPVHMAGYPCDMTAIESICQSKKIHIIQDSAHALESEWDGKKLPEFGDFSAYSFYATKNITCGEGGALASNHLQFIEKASLLSLFGISKDAWKRYNIPGYQHWETLEAGYKYNMSDMQACLGLVQLEKIEQFRKKRISIIKKYDRAFATHPCLMPFTYTSRGLHAHYLYILRLKLESLTCDRDFFMKAIETENIGVGIHFRSLLEQHYYRNTCCEQISSCPVAKDYSKRILSLPLYPSMSESDADDVIHAVLKLLHSYKK